MTRRAVTAMRVSLSGAPSCVHPSKRLPQLHCGRTTARQIATTASRRKVRWTYWILIFRSKIVNGVTTVEEIGEWAQRWVREDTSSQSAHDVVTIQSRARSIQPIRHVCVRQYCCADVIYDNWLGLRFEFYFFWKVMNSKVSNFTKYMEPSNNLTREGTFFSRIIRK